MFKKTLIASAIAMSAQFAVADDADIIKSIQSEANSIVSEFVEFESQVISEAQIGEFNAFDDPTVSNRSNFERVASFRSENLRIRFANIYIRIYERALTSSYRLIDRIEGFNPRLRDRIKGMSFYKALLHRVAFYEAEIVKYRSLLDTKQEVSRNVEVAEKTDTIVSDPVLVDTEYTVEVILEGDMRNTYEVIVKTYEVVTTTKVTQVTTTTIKYSDGSEKVEVSEKVLSETDSVAENTTSERGRLISSVPVNEDVVVDTIRTDEFYGNYALDMIGADVAYEQGYTGEGVTVAIVDTGLTDLNNKFSNIVQTYNMMDGSTNVADGNGHGTHVAGIIGANKTNDTMHGVAYNADLIIVKALDDNGSTSHQNLASAIAWTAQNGADVVNVSVSGNFAFNLEGKSELAFTNNFYKTITPVRGTDTVVVVAAGNNGLDCKEKISNWSTWAGDRFVHCGFPAALPIVEGFSDLEDQWIAVGSVNADGTISRFSNRAGVTKDWYIVAPGTDILSTSADGGYEEMTGTSMAAPIVSGAFALISEKFPHLTGSQVRAIIFQTADDLGEEGVDEEFGHGLLNVGRAMSPIGDLTLPDGTTVDGSRTKVETSAVVAPAGMGDALASAMSSVGVLDSYDRVYHIDASSTVYSMPSTFSFNNYVTGESNGIIYGLNQIQNDIHGDAVIGYKLTDRISLMYGTEKGAFGSEDTDLAGFGVDSTDYIRFGYAGDNFNVNLDYGYASGGTGTGVIESTSDLHGLGFSANYTTQFDSATHTVGLSSPIKVESGYAEVKTLTSRNIDGTLNYSSERVDLSGSDREYTLTNSLTQRVGKASTVRFNHSFVTGQETYNTASVSFNYNF